MYILGISAYYHDSAACLIKDGEILAAAQEERFTRKKHDSRFPKSAVEYCLKEAKISVKDLGYVAFYDKPFVKFERILETYLAYAPFGIKSFIKAVPLWIKKKLYLKEKKLPTNTLVYSRDGEFFSIDEVQKVTELSRPGALTRGRKFEAKEISKEQLLEKSKMNSKPNTGKEINAMRYTN